MNINHRHQPQFTFVFNDAGETRALTPVTESLEQKGVDYCILTQPGSAADRLTVNNPHKVNPLNHSELEAALNAPIEVTGLVSQFQVNYAQHFKECHKTVVGYYDAFSAFDSNVRSLEKFNDKLDILIVPSHTTAKILAKYNSEATYDIAVLGHPTLDKPPVEISKEEKLSRMSNLALKPDKATLLFVGNYGPTYPANFELFCQIAKQLRHQYNLLISLHPSQDGNYERKQLKAHHLDNIVSIAPRNYSTNDIVPIVEGVIVPYPSTLAVQTAFQQKRVFLLTTSNELHAPNDPAFDPFISTVIESQEDAKQIIENQLAQPKRSHSFLFRHLQIPSNATQRITEFILNLLKTTAYRGADRQSA